MEGEGRPCSGCKEAKDFEAGHFATAVNVNADDPATIDAILPDDKKYINHYPLLFRKPFR